MITVTLTIARGGIGQAHDAVSQVEQIELSGFDAVTHWRLVRKRCDDAALEVLSKMQAQDEERAK
jgi:hypothetical protein